MRRELKNALVDALTQDVLADDSKEILSGKLETFLTCRALAEKLDNRAAEEYALIRIYHLLSVADSVNYADLQLLISVLPDILPRPFKIVKNIVKIFSLKFLPAMIEAHKGFLNWDSVKRLHDLQRLLSSIWRRFNDR